MKTEFITNKVKFKEYQKEVFSIFDKQPFEKNPFKKTFKFFSGFEFDVIFHEFLFNKIILFLNNINNKNFVLYTIDPSPEEYFFKNFNKFSVFEFDIQNDFQDFENILYADPGNNTADAIGINSNEIAIFSESKGWAILASRDWEIGVVGFKSLQIKEKFLYSFGESADIFTSVKEQVNILDEMLKFDEKIKEEYLQLALNYKDR